MSKLKTFLGLIALTSFSLVGCATVSSAPAAEPAVAATTEATPTGCDSCAKGKAGETVWCAHCKKGFHEGTKIGCEGCYKAKAEGAACTSCPKSAEVDADADATVEKATPAATDTTTSTETSDTGAN